MDDVRNTLERLIRERGEDYHSISRLLGRNAAYIQQFMHRGTPRKLAEEDRHLLSRFFGVDERELGASVSSGTAGTPKVVMVPRLRLGASAGAGAVAGSEALQGNIGFEAAWLRKLSGSPAALSIIQVSGDSMAPTLTNGDDILVDRADAGARIRDGIYVLRIDDALLVKRVKVNASKHSLAVLSDNAAYPGMPKVDPETVDVIGRVIWTGRKIS
jgi:phage repressor protein C with HTH and peptisase S24 domain